MDDWGYSKKKGRAYRKTSKRGISYEGIGNSLRNSGTYIHQPTEEEQFEFIREKMQRIQDQSNKVWADKIKSNISLENREIFQHAIILLKPAIPFIASVDPTMTTIYGAYRFGKFGYGFASQVNQEAKISGSYEQALRTVTEKTVDEKSTSKLKSRSITKGSEFAGKGIWAHYKEKNPDVDIPNELDKHAENALIHTFEEIGGIMV